MGLSYLLGLLLVHSVWGAQPNPFERPAGGAGGGAGGPGSGPASQPKPSAIEQQYFTARQQYGPNSPQAGDLLRKVIKENPQHFMAQFHLACWFLWNHEFDNSIRQFKKVKRMRNMPGDNFLTILPRMAGFLNEKTPRYKLAFRALRTLYNRLANDKGSPPLNLDDLLELQHTLIVRAYGGKDPPNMCQQYMPGLTTRRVHDSSRFLLSRELESQFSTIKSEIMDFLRVNGSKLIPVGKSTGRSDANLVEKGKWLDISLFKSGIMNKKNCANYFPKTCKLVEDKLPEVWTDPYSHVVISQLLPGTQIKAHAGATNGQLTYHLGIQIPKNGKVAGINIGNSTYDGPWQEGKVFVFDDTYKHFVWHKGSESDGPRTILLLRGWHPEVSLDERKEVIDRNPFWMAKKEQKKRQDFLKGAKKFFKRGFTLFRRAC